MQVECWRRQKRLAELERARRKIQFGSVRQITRTEFVREVSAASDLCWVVVHLFKDGCALKSQACQWDEASAGTLAHHLLTPCVRVAQIGHQRSAVPVSGRACIQVPSHKVCEHSINGVRPQLPRPEPADSAGVPPHAMRAHAGWAGRLWRAADDPGECVPRTSYVIQLNAVFGVHIHIESCTADVAAALNAVGPVCAAPQDQEEAADAEHAPND